MLELLKLYRYNSLHSYYQMLKNEAKELLSSGNISEYLQKLTEVQKVRLQLVHTTGNN